MSEVLAVSPGMEDEPPTVEGRLAHVFIEAEEIRIDDYRLSDEDRSRVVNALKLAALVKDIAALPR